MLPIKQTHLPLLKYFHWNN